MADENKDSTQGGNGKDESCRDEMFPAAIAFSTFLLSLSTSALVCLGELPDPLNNERSTNLPLAKQTIGIIEMLKEKTKNNLTEDEERLIGDILYDLHMKYVKIV